MVDHRLLPQPTLMPKLLSLHLEQLGYSLAELQSLLSMYEDELVEFHNLASATRPPGRPKLRIVS